MRDVHLPLDFPQRIDPVLKIQICFARLDLALALTPAILQAKDSVVFACDIVAFTSHSHSVIDSNSTRLG